jgi:hypothetical protein
MLSAALALAMMLLMLTTLTLLLAMAGSGRRAQGAPVKSVYKWEEVLFSGGKVFSALWQLKCTMQQYVEH